MTTKRRTPDIAELALFRGTATLFFVLLVFGGGGAPDPLFQGILEALSFLWLMFLGWFVLFRRAPAAEATALGLIVAAIAVLFFFQIIPLPYSWWSALPGRAIPAEALAAAGFNKPSMPLSLDPEQSVVTIVALVPGVTLALATYLMSSAQRLALLKLVIVASLITALLGAVQFSAPGTSALYIHKKTYFDLPSGIFANRNFQADFLLQGILLCGLQLRLSDFKGTLAQKRASVAPFDMLCAAAIPFLALMTLASLSRFGTVMLVPVLAFAFVLAWRPGWRLFAVAAALAALVPLAAPFVAPGLSSSLLIRFNEGGSRFDLIPDTWIAAMKYFPAGSGLGTFDPVFRQTESLGMMESAYFNHAHNDYLEILIEAGLAGIILVAVFLVAFAIRAAVVWRSQLSNAAVRVQSVAAVMIAIILLHSAVDYPLRTFTLQALFAVLAAILFSRNAPSDSVTRADARRAR